MKEVEVIPAFGLVVGARKALVQFFEGGDGAAIVLYAVAVVTAELEEGPGQLIAHGRLGLFVNGDVGQDGVDLVFSHHRQVAVGGEAGNKVVALIGKEVGVGAVAAAPVVLQGAVAPHAVEVAAPPLDDLVVVAPEITPVDVGGRSHGIAHRQATAHGGGAVVGGGVGGPAEFEHLLGPAAALGLGQQADAEQAVLEGDVLQVARHSGEAVTAVGGGQVAGVGLGHDL